jgi:hypothetical protein
LLPLRALAAEPEIGVAAYNAAYSFLGPLLEKPLDGALRAVEVNVQRPLKFIPARLLTEKQLTLRKPGVW